MSDREEPVRLAIFISGRGSNMMTLVESCLAGDIPAKPVLVLSNKYSAAGLEWASERGLPGQLPAPPSHCVAVPNEYTSQHLAGRRPAPMHHQVVVTLIRFLLR